MLAEAGPAAAHSLDSSTISLHTSGAGATATVSVALEAVDESLGTSYTSVADVSSYADELVAYLDDHLTVTGPEGALWTETWSSPVRESVEGITSFRAQVALDPAGADPAAFTLDYDAVIEADPSHEAVVVLTDATGQVSTAGVLTAEDSSLSLGTLDVEDGLADMVGHGLHHVLAGADHLLFLLTLLLVAPLIARSGRWQRRAGILPTVRSVLGVVTAFTVGHSLTLIASALGWVSVPSRPVEVLVALSVAVSALHALRPLVRRGEQLLALTFGLVHGLAFAGILTSLGLDRSLSVLTLLAFNLGVELAQLTTVVLLVPWLYALSRTSWYTGARCLCAGVALAASAGWVLDRLGVLPNPLAGLEAAAVEHLWLAPTTAAVIALTALLARRTRTDDVGGVGRSSRGPSRQPEPCHGRSRRTA